MTRIPLEAWEKQAIPEGPNLAAMKPSRDITLWTLIEELKAEHPHDSYGSCVTCYKPHTDDGRQAWPCETLQIVARIDTQLRLVQRMATPYKCPVCNGTGLVSTPVGPWHCRVCQGTGVLWKAGGKD